MLGDETWMRRCSEKEETMVHNRGPCIADDTGQERMNRIVSAWKGWMAMKQAMICSPCALLSLLGLGAKRLSVYGL